MFRNASRTGKVAENCYQLYPCSLFRGGLHHAGARAPDNGCGPRAGPQGKLRNGLKSVPYPNTMAKSSSSSASSTSTVSATSPASPPALPASYEAALQELEALVSSLESGQLPLDQLLTGYQRGAQLLKFCRDKLEAVETQIKVLEGTELKPWAQE